jgi:hypothetical protein
VTWSLTRESHPPGTLRVVRTHDRLLPVSFDLTSGSTLPCGDETPRAVPGEPVHGHTLGQRAARPSVDPARMGPHDRCRLRHCRRSRGLCRSRWRIQRNPESWTDLARTAIGFWQWVREWRATACCFRRPIVATTRIDRRMGSYTGPSGTPRVAMRQVKMGCWCDERFLCDPSALAAVLPGAAVCAAPA